MGGCSSKTLSNTPIVAYAQANSRSQVHEVAVIPLVRANFPDPSCFGFRRLHEIYRTCPRVRQHFANSGEEPLSLEKFFQQVVVDASHPALPDGSTLPVAVATRWRGDDGWDIAGYIGCRGFDNTGARTEVCQLQMFFKDGHKVPLTMPAVQLAARLFCENHMLAASTSFEKNHIPWPRNVEWTVRRQNMEVRRVLEAVLVFWGQRPARSGSPDQLPPPAPMVDQSTGRAVVPLTISGPGAAGFHPPPAYAGAQHQQHHMSYGSHQMMMSPQYQQQQHQLQHGFGAAAAAAASATALCREPALRDCAPFLPSFPLEQRSVCDELATLGCGQAEAISSFMSDLACWSSGPLGNWATGVVPSPGLEQFLPTDFAARGGKMLLTSLSMNFRGTQQKTPVERREVMGDEVSDMLELIQPAPRDPSDPAAIQQEANQLRREQRRAQQQQQQAQQQQQQHSAKQQHHQSSWSQQYQHQQSAINGNGRLPQYQHAHAYSQQQQPMMQAYGGGMPAAYAAQQQQQQPQFTLIPVSAMHQPQQLQQQPQQVLYPVPAISPPPQQQQQQQAGMIQAPAGFTIAFMPMANGTMQQVLVPNSLLQQQQQQQPQSATPAVASTMMSRNATMSPDAASTPSRQSSAPVLRSDAFGAPQQQATAASYHLPSGSVSTADSPFAAFTGGAAPTTGASSWFVTSPSKEQPQQLSASADNDRQLHDMLRSLQIGSA